MKDKYKKNGPHTGSAFAASFGVNVFVNIIENKKKKDPFDTPTLNPQDKDFSAKNFGGFTGPKFICNAVCNVVCNSVCNAVCYAVSKAVSNVECNAVYNAVCNVVCNAVCNAVFNAVM